MALRANGMAAGLVLPRIKAAIGASRTAHAQAAAAVGGALMTSHVGIVRQDTQKISQTTRIYPATQGELGPHPAREPEPV